jgi:hypothetical protein
MTGMTIACAGTRNRPRIQSFARNQGSGGARALDPMPDKPFRIFGGERNLSIPAEDV